MSYSWWYTPICIRFISKGETHSLSGVNLILQDQAHNVYVDYILTLNHIPVSQFKNYTIYITSKHLIGEVDVKWITAEYNYHIPIFSRDDRQDPLYKFLMYFEQHGFKLLPNNLLLRNDLYSLNLLGLKVDKPLFQHVSLSNYNPMEFVQGKKLDPINIESYPFNFTNPILFSSFKTSGHLNYVLASSTERQAYLSDIKYLENMSGGVVSLDKGHGSIGLLMGNLKKLNGDGDLLIILSWSRIFKLVIGKFHNKLLMSNLRIHHDASTQLSRPIRGQKSILPLVVSNDASQYWGSVTYFNETTLVTNTHVLQPLIDNEPRTNAIMFLTPDHSIELTQDDVIVTPFPQLDLSFIRISTRVQQSLSGFTPVQLASANTDENVNTIGYGLFFNSQHIQPIVSEGIISTQLSLPMYRDSDTKVPILIITNSSCWNGSSGGGLFNRQDQFLGLICCNATVRLPQFGSDAVVSSDQVEKLSKFSLILPAEVIAEGYRVMMRGEAGTRELNDRVGSVWGLHTYHRDVIVNEREAKL